jgi:hypothetical protein
MTARGAAIARICASARSAQLDYGAFVQHGIASLNIDLGGEDGGGIYHSILRFLLVHKLRDTDFVYGRAGTNFGDSCHFRLADADILPFGVHDFMTRCRVT